MKIIALSDSHCNELDLPGGDLLIHAGDFLAGGTAKEFYKFVAWWNKERPKFKHAIIVPGNHDLYVERNLNLAKEALDNTHLLIDEGVEIEGLKIWGSPWVNYINGIWAWEFDGEDRWEKKNGIYPMDKYKHIPEGLDILITHQPCKGILSGPWGSEELHQKVLEVKPRLHILGHIHGSAGSLKTTNTHFYNVAVCDDNNRLVRGFTEIEL